MSVPTPKINKNIIDLLMFSLYSDSRTIYREYVQNALDAINAAVSAGILNDVKDGVVNITIDEKDKSISINDNGCGIQASDAPSRLLDICASTKDGISTAGQFGIGRLAGGGYCHKLVFKTSAVGEELATMVTFDVDSIWKMVKEDRIDYPATDVLSRCTSVEQIKEDFNEHYFEVTLLNVKSEMAPALLDTTQIIQYLQQIAPVEYTVEFSNAVIHKKNNIFSEYQKLHDKLPHVQLLVNGQKILKQYGLKVTGAKNDLINNLEYFSLDDPKYGTLGWGWFALTKFTCQIDKNDNKSCIRLRKHNIQIGDFNLLSGKPLWSEDRGNSYFYGEIFATHPNLVPDASRDGLAPTPEKESLYAQLKDRFRALTNIYTKANVVKVAINKILEGIEKIKKTQSISTIVRDTIDNKGIATVEREFNKAKDESLKRMLSLYKEDFNEAIIKLNEVEEIISRRSYQEPESQETSDPLHGQDDSNTSNIDSQNGQDQPMPNQTSDSSTGESSCSDGASNEGGQHNNESNVQEGTNGQDEEHEKFKSPLNPLLADPDLINQLSEILDESEQNLLRRVFKVLNTYCPTTESDIALIRMLKNRIVTELQQNGI